ncbi:MAG: FHA domain-containing protein, partial [Planctomycetales bacterium]
MQAKLVVIEGKTNRPEIDLNLPMIVGRRRDSDLVIMHKSVSRQHCELVEQDGQVVVRDNHSANGTFINNKQISEKALRPGDKLRVGPLTFLAEITFQSGTELAADESLSEVAYDEALLEAAADALSEADDDEALSEAAADDSLSEAAAEAIAREIEEDADADL